MSLTPSATVSTHPEPSVQHRIYQRCLACYFDSRNDKSPDRSRPSYLCPSCLISSYSVRCSVCGHTLKDENCPLLKLLEETLVEAEPVKQIEVEESAPATPEAHVKEMRTRDQDEDKTLHGPSPTENGAHKLVKELKVEVEDAFGAKINSNDVAKDGWDRRKVKESQRSFKKIIKTMDVIKEDNNESDEDDGTVFPRANPPVLRKHCTRRDLRLDYRSSSSKEDNGNYSNLSSAVTTETDPKIPLDTTTQTTQTQTCEDDLPGVQTVCLSDSTSAQNKEYLEKAAKEVSDTPNLPTNVIFAQRLIEVSSLAQDDSRADKLASQLPRLSIDTSVSRCDNPFSDTFISGDSCKDTLDITESCPNCHHAACPVCPSQARDLVVDMAISKTCARELRYCTHCHHGLCPRNFVEIIMKCSVCGHKACMNCGNKRTRRVEVSSEPGVGVGNWEMGIVSVDMEEETWCICCRCKRIKEDEKEDRLMKKRSTKKGGKTMVRFEKSSKENEESERNIESWFD